MLPFIENIDRGATPARSPVAVRGDMTASYLESVMNEKAYMIASDGIASLIDKMMEAGAKFEDALSELRDQIDTCEADGEAFTG